MAFPVCRDDFDGRSFRRCKNVTVDAGDSEAQGICRAQWESDKGEQKCDPVHHVSLRQTYDMNGRSRLASQGGMDRRP